jgi:transposase
MSIIYLYKKIHNKTGLQYLGKTISSDPHKYQGSGTHWKKHIKKHGYDVTTEILRECFSKEEVKEWGLYYSKL